MSEDIKKGFVEARHGKARLAPVGYEDHAMDEAIEALGDVAECDDSDIFIKWDKAPTGHTVPLLYILFAKVVGQGKLPLVHLDPKGVKRPALIVCLAHVRTGELLSWPELRDVVRRSVETYLGQHGIRMTPMGHVPEPLVFRPLEFEKKAYSGPKSD